VQRDCRSKGAEPLPRTQGLKYPRVVRDFLAVYGEEVMRLSGGGLWVCLALLGLGACSSPAPPPAEGSARLTFTSCSYSAQSINGPNGEPRFANGQLGQTVLDGRDGNHVSCKVFGSGLVDTSISSPNMTLTVSGTVAGNTSVVTMTFLTSALLNTRSSSTCTLTVHKLIPGSIWADYSCTNVVDYSNLGTPCATNGEFVFTGCAKE